MALLSGQSVICLRLPGAPSHKNSTSRLKPAEESAIAEVAEAAAKCRGAADVLEREIASVAEGIISNFIAENDGHPKNV